MTREDALGLSGGVFDSGAFFAALARRVAVPSVSIDSDLALELPRYLTEGLGDQLVRLGCQTEIHDNPLAGGPPILVPEWRPDGIPDAVRQAVRDLKPGGGVGPTMDADWGEPGLSPGEQVFGWNSFEVLALEAGDPAAPAAAVPPDARATCALRYVVPCDPEQFLPALRRHLDAQGLERVTLRELPGHLRATRLDPDHPRVAWAMKILGEASGKDPVLLPNLGGSLPNDVFAEVLGLPTLWVPHSYPACRQHGPDEHLLAPVVREALLLMTALFWELGAEEPG